MKAMKKNALALVMALAMIFSMAACSGGGSGPVGKYDLVKMNMDGMEVNVKDMAKQMGVEMNIVLEIKANNTFSLDMSAMGTSESLAGEWALENNQLVLTADGDSIPAKLSGKTLVLEQDGQSMTFEKQ